MPNSLSIGLAVANGITYADGPMVMIRANMSNGIQSAQSANGYHPRRYVHIFASMHNHTDCKVLYLVKVICRPGSKKGTELLVVSHSSAAVHKFSLDYPMIVGWLPITSTIELPIICKSAKQWDIPIVIILLIVALIHFTV